MSEQVKLTVSKQQVRLVPGSSTQFEAINAEDEREFEVTVVNTSDRFASFQIQLETEGLDPDESEQWYTVEPEICAKKPPGDRTTFRILVTKAPIPAYDSKLQVQIRVLSAEFSSLTTSETIFLEIGRSSKSLRLYLPQEELSVYPGDRLNIPVLIYNLSPKFARIRLNLTGLDDDWFLDGTGKDVEIPAGDSKDVIFYCRPPKTPQIQSRVYDFKIEAEDQDRSTAEQAGSLEILPYGLVECSCRQRILTIPHRTRQSGQSPNRVQFIFDLQNLSNLAQRVDFQITNLRNNQSQDTTESTVTLESNQEQEASWSIQRSRPWVGGRQRIQYQVTPTLTQGNSGNPSDPVYVQPSSQVIEVKVLPILPWWVQLGGGLLALFLLSFLWWSNPKRYHTAPVTAVRIIGNETTVVSGSRDQSIQRWNVNPFAMGVEERRLRHQQPLTEDLPRSVRVIQESPYREGRIAIGLENGSIALWEVSPPQPIDDFQFDQSDRIFDLDFTNDGRFLFSGHGSGIVRQWDLTSSNDSTPLHQLSSEGSISTMSVIDPVVFESPQSEDIYLLAMGGQYNQLNFWDWEQKTLFQADYQYLNETAIAPVIGQYQYINSIAVNTDNTVMATADNRGYVTLWDLDSLRQCVRDQASISRNAQREIERDDFGNETRPLPCNWDDIYVDQWQIPGNDHQSIRSLALSDDGCYLTGVGDTGQVFLWLLTSSGRRSPLFPDAEILADFPNTSLSSVDIDQPDEDYLYVVSDAPENQVRLYRYPVPSDHTCSSSVSAHLVTGEANESL